MVKTIKINHSPIRYQTKNNFDHLGRNYGPINLTSIKDSLLRVKTPVTLK